MRPGFNRRGLHRFLPWAALAIAVLLGPAPAALVISEFMASNGDSLLDSDGDACDWIELSNSGPEPVDLAGYFLTDDAESPDKWSLPDPLTLAPGEYLIVFASGKNRRVAGAELHTNFSLNMEGEYLGLVRPDGVSVEHEFAPAYPPQERDVSYGLDPAAGEDRYFRQPTPGEPNSAGIAGFVAAPEFSAPVGFYREPFQLEITCATEGARIRYTTDGQKPSLLTARTYTGSLTINKTTVLRVSASLGSMEPSPVVTRTFLFLDDILNQPNTAPSGAHWDTEMDPAVTGNTTQTWSVADALLSMPALSVVMPDADLFGARGIYKNPGQRGIESERSCSVEYFFPDEYAGYRGGDGFAVDCGIVINGNFSRLTTNPKHSFRLKFKSIHGPPKLRYPLFAERGTSEFDTLLVATGHNEGWATGQAYTQLLRNQFSRDLQGMDPSHFTARGHWVHLYLNGLYWGVYGFHERPDDAFGADNFGGEKEEYDVFKGLRAGGSSQALMIAGERAAWAELFRIIESDLTIPENYAAVQSLIDLDQLIDYTIGTLYTGDLDGPTGLGVQATQPKNFYAMRRRAEEGRFRFFRWDTEFTLQNVNEDVSERRGTENPARLHFNLRRIADYRIRFADRVQRFFFHDGPLTPEAVIQRYLALAEFIDKGIVAESARWGDSRRKPPYTRDGDWVRERDRLLQTWFPRRSEIVLSQFRWDGLVSENVAPQFLVNGEPKHGGLLQDGDLLTMIAPGSSLFNRGYIYYTINGLDPRDSVTGRPSPEAVLYDRQPFSLPGNAHVRARGYTLPNAVWSALSEADFLTEGRPPVPGDLVISELHYHPGAPSVAEAAAGFTQRNFFEFVEFLNVSEDALELSGVHVAEGFEFVFAAPGLTRLEPGARLLVVSSRAAFEMRYGSGLPIAGEFASGRLDDAGERIRVLDAAGNLLIDLTYDDNSPWPEASDGEGPSLVFTSTDGSADPSDPALWTASATSGGTPGHPESGSVETYEDWAKTEFGDADPPPALAAPEADPDGDGAANLLEFALRSVPTDPASLPDLQIHRREAGFIEIRYPSPLSQSAAGIAIQLEISKDLVQWDETEGEILALDPRDSRSVWVTAKVPISAGSPEAGLRFKVRFLP